jgi:hypothetical protein
MSVGSFIGQFTYEADRIDSFHIIDKAPHKGDCDDFAITVAYLDAGSVLRMWWKIITLQTQIYWCKSPSNEAHIILWVRGRGWIDNIFREWRDRPTGHTRRWYLPFPWIALKLAIGKVARR